MRGGGERGGVDVLKGRGGVERVCVIPIVLRWHMVTVAIVAPQITRRSTRPGE